MKTDIYIVDSRSEIVAERLENPDSFSEYRRKRILAVKPVRSKLLLTAAGIAVEEGLKKYGLVEHDTVFGLSDKEKPYIEGHPEIIFNVSHSGDYAVAAFLRTNADRQPDGYMPAKAVLQHGSGVPENTSDAGIGIKVISCELWGLSETDSEGFSYSAGIDIERIGRMSRRIAPVTAGDVGFGSPDPMRDLCRQWTAREAFVKCIGTGIVSIREDFHFEKTASGEMRLCQELYDGEFTLTEPEAPEGYCMTCIVRKYDADSKCKHGG